MKDKPRKGARRNPIAKMRSEKRPPLRQRHSGAGVKKILEKIESLATFPSEDPYPVLRIKKDNTLLYANPASVSILTDWSFEYGRPVPQLWQDLVQDVFKDGLKKDIEIDHKGQVFLFTVVPNIDAGYANFYALEITHLKKIQQELNEAYYKLRNAQVKLIQAEKLSAVGELASGAAHEVKNPLAIILQGVNYLEKKIPPEEKDNFKTLTIIKESIERADKIIESLLNFSKVGKLDLKTEDINSILDKSLELVWQRLKFTPSIEVVNEKKEGLPKVLADRAKMEQIFINIFLNAIQAMDGKGKIFVRTYDKILNQVGHGVGRRGSDYFRLGERAVIVEIEDTGKGISEENLNRIFDPFFTTKSRDKGTGLGLSICKSILDLHKSLIEAESVEGKGAKMIMTLKIAEEDTRGADYK